MSTLNVNQIYEADGSQFRFNTDVVLIQSQTGNDLGAALIFDDLDVSTYKSFRLAFALLPDNAVDGYYFNLRFRTGGSSGADDTTSNYNFDYHYSYQTDGGAQIARIDYSYAGINHTVGATDANEGVNGFMDITFNRSPDSFDTGAGGTYAHWSTAMFNESANYRGSSGRCAYNNSSIVNHTGFKIYMGTGTAESGGFDKYKYALYGVKG